MDLQWIRDNVRERTASSNRRMPPKPGHEGGAYGVCKASSPLFAGHEEVELECGSKVTLETCMRNGSVLTQRLLCRHSTSQRTSTMGICHWRAARSLSEEQCLSDIASKCVVPRRPASGLRSSSSYVPPRNFTVRLIS
eukprot:scaffold228993_cov31-Tisochrysis_lutea.AAC.2